MREELKSDILELREELKLEMVEINNKLIEFKSDTEDNFKDLKNSFELLRATTKADISESKAELLRWMFIFWVRQAATTIAIILVVFKH